MHTLVLHPENESQINSIIKLAHDLQVRLEIMDEDSLSPQIWLKMAETSFSNEWNNDKDSHWDEYLKSAKDVSER